MIGFVFVFKYFSASGIASIIASASALSILVVTPGNAFCSCIAVFIPSFAASLKTGPLTYPPVPTTISGLSSLSKSLDFLEAEKTFFTASIFRLMFLRLTFL